MTEKTLEQLQILVDRMVYENGNGVLDSSDRDEVLAKYGLKRKEVTERMIEKADERARKLLKETLKQQLSNGNARKVKANPSPKPEGRRAVIPSGNAFVVDVISMDDVRALQQLVHRLGSDRVRELAAVLS